MKAIDYTPIRASTLRGKLEITFDLFVLINEKFILYYRKGDSFEGERIERIQKKGLKKLYILKVEEEEYKSYLRRNIDMAYSNTQGAPMSERAIVIQGAQQAVVENLMESPDDKQIFEVAVESSRMYVEFILNENAALKEILKIPNLDKNPAHHGVNVATLAIAICKRFKQTDPAMLNALVIGCLLHDIEFAYNGLSLAKDFKDLSPEEKEIYKRQPHLGYERIKDAGFYQKLTLDIVKQSEELIDGSGFPDGLKEDQVDPMVALASTCNAFDRYVSIKEYSIKDSLKSILIDRMGMHPLKYFQALQDALKDDGAL